LWIDLRKKYEYEGDFDRADFDMFDKYVYFYGTPHKVMNVVIYFGLDKNDMDSSKLTKDMHDICKILQKDHIETVREAVYLFKLYDMDHIIYKRLIVYQTELKN